MSRKRHERDWPAPDADGPEDAPTREERETAMGADGVADPPAATEPEEPAYTLLDEDEGDLARQLGEWKDRAFRATAEMENIRRRAQIEAQNAKKFANEGLLYDLLPVLDNFAAALTAAETTKNVDALKSGVELIQRQLSEVLHRAGLRHIEAVGAPFDPNYHQAVMQVEPEDGQDPMVVIEELRRGYSLNDRVLRPTLVKVTSG